METSLAYQITVESTAAESLNSLINAYNDTKNNKKCLQGESTVKIATFLSYCFAGLGIVFFIVTVVFIFTSVRDSDISLVSYPYHPLAGPSLLTGLVFFNLGIFGIWIEYLRVKRRQKALSGFRLREHERERIEDAQKTK